MTGRSLEETRREFLLRLARGATLVAPVVATLRPDAAAAQDLLGSLTGSLSPLSTTSVQQQPTSSEQLAPWEPAGATQSPPWERPPPTASGG